jgi:hypothetical protein
MKRRKGSSAFVCVEHLNGNLAGARTESKKSLRFEVNETSCKCDENPGSGGFSLPAAFATIC